MATIEKRVTDDGQTRYRVKVRMRGYPPQSATFERKTDARRWASQTETAIREGRYFRTAEASRHTLAELIDRYSRDVLPYKGRQRFNQARQLAWWRREYGEYTLADITPARIAEGRDRLRREPNARNQQRGPATVNRYLAALSHAFTTAVREWEWVDDTPFRKVAKLPEPKGRVRFLIKEESVGASGELQPGELSRLLTACRASDCPLLYPIVVLALSTGVRKGELLGLRWADVDLEGQRIVLHETKNGERRAVPLVGRARDELKALKENRSGKTEWVFPNPSGERPIDIRCYWHTARKRAEIEDFRFHDLRHTTASYLAMNGASPSEIAAVLGHKTLAMVKRYAHVSDNHTIGVVTRMNDAMFEEGEADG